MPALARGSGIRVERARKILHCDQGRFCLALVRQAFALSLRPTRTHARAVRRRLFPVSQVFTWVTNTPSLDWTDSKVTKVPTSLFPICRDSTQIVSRGCASGADARPPLLDSNPTGNATAVSQTWVRTCVWGVGEARPPSTAMAAVPRPVVPALGCHVCLFLVRVLTPVPVCHPAECHTRQGWQKQKEAV